VKGLVEGVGALRVCKLGKLEPQNNATAGLRAILGARTAAGWRTAALSDWGLRCVLCCAVLCCAVLCCAVLCCAALCCAVLCCAAVLC